jgi:hypothetical protein
MGGFTYSRLRLFRPGLPVSSSPSPHLPHASWRGSGRRLVAGQRRVPSPQLGCCSEVLPLAARAALDTRNALEFEPVHWQILLEDPLDPAERRPHDALTAFRSEGSNRRDRRSVEVEAVARPAAVGPPDLFFTVAVPPVFRVIRRA